MEKSGDEEAPLLASYDGVEFASSDRPSKLLHGRASFKLKISQVDGRINLLIFVRNFPKFLYIVILSFVFKMFESCGN